MTVYCLSTILAMTAPEGTKSTAPVWAQLVPIAMMMVVFYLILIRPQQKKAKEHESLLKTLRSGDKVVTNGGILGVVVTVKERSVTIRTADTKLELLKSAVVEISDRTEEAEPPQKSK